MSTLIAAVVAHPQVLNYNGLHAPLAYTTGHAPFAYATHAAPLTYAAAHAPLTYAAPAPLGYAASPAPFSYAAAPVAYAAPAPIAYTTGTKLERTYEPVEQHGYQIVYWESILWIELSAQDHVNTTLGIKISFWWNIIQFLL